MSDGQAGSGATGVAEPDDRRRAARHRPGQQGVRRARRRQRRSRSRWRRKSIVSIIGPNGAGKTTFFNMLTGLYQPTAGRITFDGKDVTGRRPDIITSLGIARTFQNIRLFSTMTALENVMVGEHSRMRAGLFGSILRTPGVRREEREVRERARETLDYVGLSAAQVDSLAINLSYGDQRRVEIARALASDPQAAPARRADRGDEPAGVGPADGVHGAAAQRARPHDPPDRARHEGRDGRLRAHHRARPRREDRRGRSPGDPRQRARDRGLPREAGRADRAAARARRRPHLLREHRGAEGHLAHRRGGRDRDADRLERGRQVHHAALDLRAHPAAQGSITFAGEEISRDRAPGHRAARHLPVARGPPLLPADVRAREPRPGRLPAPRRPRDRGPRPRLRAVPAPQGARAARRRARCRAASSRCSRSAGR